jgi:hypothetical protein
MYNIKVPVWNSQLSVHTNHITRLLIVLLSDEAGGSIDPHCPEVECRACSAPA